ncbi:MAG: hypothetical protein Q4B42_08135, partial [Oscillospiraceae bacterium]|nr:hypothetical protein [Oscillospiraceae bacterium]
ANRDDGVYCFFMGVDSEENVGQILNAIAIEAEGKADYVCGISQVFYDLSCRAAYAEQARLALEYGLGDVRGGHYYSFTKLYAPIICRVGYHNIRRENLILPEIQALMRADEENSTNFFESFKCYLYSKCDMSKAASQLFL